MSFEYDIREAVRTLKEGKVILYPTDTIWGLGCDATCQKAVARIFSIKSRSDAKSLIILVNSILMLERYVREIPAVAMQIIEVSDQPVSIVYPRGKNLAGNVTSDDGSVGIRITTDPFCSQLISRFRKPIISTSANISGEPAPSDFGEISETVKSRVDYVVWHRREDRQRHKASPVIKIGMNGEIKIIRK